MGRIAHVLQSYALIRDLAALQFIYAWAKTASEGSEWPSYTSQEPFSKEISLSRPPCPCVAPASVASSRGRPLQPPASLVR